MAIQTIKTIFGVLLTLVLTPMASSSAKQRKFAKPASRVRAHWRIKCRQQLSQFLYEQVGLSIPADEVRLVTHPGDPYRWLFLPEKQHLFEKPLSKHNTGTYREICSAIGQSIEVRKRDDQGQLEIAASSRSTSFNLDPESDNSNPPTFTSTIEALTQHNKVLAERARHLKTIIEERDQSITQRQERCVTLEEQLRRLSEDLNKSKARLREAQEKYAQAEQGWADDRMKLAHCQTAVHDLLQTLK